MYRNSTSVRHQIYFLINVAVIYSIPGAPWSSWHKGEENLPGLPWQSPPCAGPAPAVHGQGGGQRAEGRGQRSVSEAQPEVRAAVQLHSGEALWHTGTLPGSSSFPAWNGVTVQEAPGLSMLPRYSRQRLGAPLREMPGGTENPAGPHIPGRQTEPAMKYKAKLRTTHQAHLSLCTEPGT